MQQSEAYNSKSNKIQIKKAASSSLKLSLTACLPASSPDLLNELKEYKTNNVRNDTPHESSFFKLNNNANNCVICGLLIEWRYHHPFPLK